MTAIDSLLILAALLFVKHFAADGPLQTNHQVAHKGEFLHPAGLAHAGAHALLSGVCLVIWIWGLAPAGVALSVLALGALLLFEFIVHYLTDYAKCRIDARYQWSRSEIGPDGARRLVIDGGPMFFIGFLADQLVHALTYVAMLALVSAFILQP